MYFFSFPPFSSPLSPFLFSFLNHAFVSFKIQPCPHITTLTPSSHSLNDFSLKPSHSEEDPRLTMCNLNLENSTVSKRYFYSMRRTRQRAKGTSTQWGAIMLGVEVDGVRLDVNGVKLVEDALDEGVCLRSRRCRCENTAGTPCFVW